MGNSLKPRSRTKDLVVQELNGETLIYDLKEHRAMCLNETAGRVWQACDGYRTVEDIGRDIGSEEMVWLALDQLREEDLIEETSAPPSEFAGISRRELVGKIGMGAMLAIPIVAAITAPTAAQSTSGLPDGSTCTSSGQCQSGCCRTVGQGNICATGQGQCLP